METPMTDAKLQGYADELQSLCNLQDDDLYFELGQAIVPRDEHISRESLIARGRKWFVERRDEIVKVFCTHPGVLEYRSNDRTREKLVAVASVIDVIATKYGVVPPGVLTAVLLREGVEVVCAAYVANGIQ
jgi:hypothetical protein